VKVTELAPLSRTVFQAVRGAAIHLPLNQAPLPLSNEEPISHLDLTRVAVTDESSIARSFPDFYTECYLSLC